MRTNVLVLVSVAAASSILLCGCGSGGGGGGGGGGPPSLFPAGVTAQDLVAVRFSALSSGIPTIVLADALGRGQVTVPDTGFKAGGVTDDMQWSPDHSRLAVLVQPDGTTDDILYVVEPLTATIHAVSGPQTPGTYVQDFQWSPDSSRLAFIRNGPIDAPLFVVGADGSGLVPVSGTLVSGGHLSLYEWSPDSTKLALVMAAESPVNEEVYVVPRDGSGRVKVSGTTPASSDGIAFPLWSPDSSRVAYFGNLESSGVFEAFVSLATGVGGRTKIHPALVAGGNVQNIAWAPNGSRIAYVADQVTNDVQELFTSLPDGTGNTKVSGTLVAGGFVEDRFDWAPDSSRIAFAARKDSATVRELYTVPGDGSAAPIKVSGAMVAGGNVGSAGSMLNFDVVWAPDSSRIAYIADAELNGAFGLYVTLAASASPVRVSPTPVASDQIFGCVAWTPDSSRVAFELLTGASADLRIAPPGGPSVAMLPAGHGFASVNENPFTFAGNRLLVEFSPDGVAPPEVRSYGIPSLAESVVATPDVDPNFGLDEFE